LRRSEGGCPFLQLFLIRFFQIKPAWIPRHNASIIKTQPLVQLFVGHNTSSFVRYSG
jgi:hypothetical protein